jgi:ribosomal protein S18 acetylase RimI-like enzyme
LVINSEITDLDIVYRLFDRSVDYQTRNGYPDWKHYDRDAIIADIHSKSQYKVVIGSEIAILFSVRYTDSIIWREYDRGDALYLHRIVVNPDFKGQKLFGDILTWSLAHCKERSLRHIRMDTWASNDQLIKYYQGFGFRFIENFTTPDDGRLPVHNRNLALALLEYQP